MDHWEEEIDVDDSDLPSLLHPIPFPPPSSSSATLPLSLPYLHPCSQFHPPSLTPNPNPPPPPPLVCERENESAPSKNANARPLIPGPAGAVQAAMHRKAAAQNPLFNSEEQNVPRPDIVQEEEDGDFKLNPWLCAINFLGLGPDFALKSPIGSVKIQRSTTDRIPQVVGIVKSCVPNGLGDLFITLKDPTGTIGSSIHRKVLLESNLGRDISVGCVLILKQVAIFRPGRSVCYLNVTLNNVVKLFCKDCGPPNKQMMLSSTARYGASGPAERLSSVRHSAEPTADNELRRNADIERMMDSRKTGLAGSLPCGISARDATTNMAAHPDLRTIATTNMAAQPDLRTIATTNMAAKPDLRTNLNSARDGTTNMAAKPNLGTNEPKKLISRVSVAQWTDEQLLELFSDYQDDSELVLRSI